VNYSDEKLQGLISITLRSGVFAAASIGLIGGLLFFASSPQPADFHSFQGASMPFSSPQQILRQAFLQPGEEMRLRGLSIVQIGVLFLLMTPVIRVVFSIVGFAMERDRAYVLITSFVLLTLIVSICLP
jgi:uncharacterized membrane protein